MYIINCTSEEFKNKGYDTVVIPVGSVEAHGIHLPLGTDIFSPRKFCEIVDESIGDTLWIAPEIPYGNCYELSIYPGTVTMPSEAMAEYIYYIGKSFYNNGIKNIIFLNGHGGNITALNLAAEKLVKIGAVVSTINWWMDFSKEILTITEGQGHGGEDETSAILSYDEGMVHMDKACCNKNIQLYPVKFQDRGKTIFENAITGDATLATKEKGDKIFNVVAERIIGRIKLIESGIYFKKN